MKDDILIAYYSWSGNTRKIAEIIGQQTGGSLFEIKPVSAYTTNYSDAVAQAKDEIKSGFRPELVSLPDNTSYTTIFLGSPIWWYTMAPPLASFIDNFTMKGKTVVPFYTHGGGGGGTYENDIAKMSPGSIIKQGFGTYNSGGHDAQAQINAWLSSIGIDTLK